MLSRQEFADATTFLATYQDALKTVEQIAEKRQAYDHYEQTTSQVVNGMKNNEVSLNEGSAVGGAKKDSFVYVRAQQHAQEVAKSFKIDSASSRDTFV
jgi:hypothetical protein